MNILQDILGLFKRKVFKSPKDEDVIVLATVKKRKSGRQNQSKDETKLDPGLVKFKDLKASIGGQTNTASNIGTGEGLFAQKTGSDLEFKSINSTDFNVTGSADEVTIQASSLLIDNKSIVTPISGMQALVEDSGTLKKVDVNDFLGGGGGTEPYIQESLAYPYNNPSSFGNSATSFSSGWCYTVPFVLQSDVNINAITINITTPAVGDAYFGVYEWDGNPGDNHIKIFQETTAFNTNVSGVQTITLSTPYTLQKGKRLTCCLISNSTYSTRSIRIGNFGSGILGYNSTITDYFNFYRSFSATLVGSTMPASISFQRSKDPNSGVIPFVLHLENA